MGECEHGGCVMIIEFAKEVVNKRASSNSLHPPFQGAEHQKLHHFYCPCLKHRLCLNRVSSKNRRLIETKLRRQNPSTVYEEVFHEMRCISH